MKKVDREASDLEAHWTKIVEQHRAANREKFSYVPGSFKRDAWETFNPDKVLAALLEDKTSYFAHKDVLFAGLCAWAVCPRERRIIQQAMQMTVGRRLHAIEKDLPQEFGDTWMLADLLIRIRKIGPEFYDEMYFTVGGLSGLLAASRKSLLSKRLKAKAIGLPHLLSMMRIFHHQIATGDKEYPSLNKGSDLVHEISCEEIEPPSGRVIKEFWAKHKASIAYSYAASTIFTGEQRTLLDEMLDESASLRKHASLLPEWAGKAQYAADAILGKLPESRVLRKPAPRGPGLIPIEIPAPHFDQATADAIRSGFARKPRGKSKAK
ncbi:hypothetical protein [Terrihabitans rhizophilus]|uniref:Uncharacterized protein n=1 Tax=Terrihabitans rhizophilus TaxID=3092662 RepID=A0ABU4RMX0_9HYPH|nr:hypothetical protein [Terrihabitans sp. PJ23]MDX6806162.1 hypothetical protein [Terrihabitans sp. PJ23]